MGPSPTMTVADSAKTLLAEEVEPLLSRLTPIVNLWQSGELTSAEAAALYILIYLQLRPPHNLALAPHRSKEHLGLEDLLPLEVEKSLTRLVDLPEGILELGPRLRQRLPPEATLFTLFGHYSLRTIPLSVNKALIHWMAGRWPIRLISYIPRPLELLREQSEGGRCVTITLAREQLGQLVLGKRDPLSFLLHDLTHAERFFGDPRSYRAQVGFFRQILRALQDGLFAEYMQKDKVFAKELEYVFADMNSYCGHLLKCLKAICLRYFLRRERLGPQDGLSEKVKGEYEDYFRTICQHWGMEGEVQAAAMRLNTESFQPERDFLLLENHFLDQAAL